MTTNTVFHAARPLLRSGAFALLVLAGVAGLASSRSRAEDAHAIPPAALDETSSSNQTETAVFAGGCFWGVQGVFQHVKGVKEAMSGYAGGEKSTAEYHVVGTGTTGHAEFVRVTYDPKKVSYGKLLQIYFSVVSDPTDFGGQGPDRGTQYRSAIFPESADQQKVAQAYIAQLDSTKSFAAPIVTTVEPGKNFYAAEDYHQNFLTLNPTYGYIVANDLPKIENLKRLLPESYKPEPVLVAVASKPSN